MKSRMIKASAAMLSAVMAIGGTVGVLADAPTAGVTSYTASVVSSATAPTAGFAAAAMQAAIDSEEDAKIASAEVEAPEVAVSEFANIAVAQVEAFVYVRSEANADSEYVGKLYTNNAATVLEELDGWYKIQSGNVEGYVSADYVVVGDEALAESVSRREATVHADTLYVREEANADASVMDYVADGEKLTVTDETIEGWVGVAVENGSGYVSAEYVTIETVYSYAESKEEEIARLEREEAERKAAEEAARREAERQAAASSGSSSSSSSNRTYNPPTGGGGQAVVDYAVQFVGNPYVYGGSSLTGGTDCSGFTMSVYSAFGVSLPHSSSSQRSVGYAVDPNDMSTWMPGDIVCYSGHVAIYMGGGAIVHASNRSDGIKISYDANYRSVVAVRRIF